MNPIDSRRTFLKRGSAATVGLLAAGVAGAQDGPDPVAESESPSQPGRERNADRELDREFRKFSREEPSYGGPVGDANYLGKLVPGRRGSGLPPVPFQAPDLGKIPWKIVDGAHTAA